MKLLPILFAALFLASVHAWNWNNYTGLSSWHVSVTEDDSGCGGSATTSQMTMPIEHNGNSATVTDPHGTIGGTFASGNVLHIPGRTINDPPGSSVLSAYDIFFTTDCSAFAARYTWDYSGPDGACSGSTRLAGTNSQGCPQVVQPTRPPEASVDDQLSAAQNDLRADMQLRSDLRFLKLQDLLFGDSDAAAMAGKQSQIDQLDASAEAKYKAILDNDPNNYQANIAMAQLRKSQGLPHEYYQYMDRAINSGQFTEEAKAAAEKNLAKQMGLSTIPKAANSLLMKTMSAEKSNWQGGLYGMDVPKESQKDWNWKVFFTDGPWKYVINTATYK
ncbi:Uncharacterised protein [Candidatus Burarchaeum australiense]|nr:Uncharacterised protein [Candidatus Burarchaeum australiense]